MRREDLLTQARAATPRAWAPYSKFRVGAAVEAADGSVHAGVNIENASYGLTVCAERVAIQTAVAAGHRRFIRIAISCEAGPGAQPENRMPCGPCRQVMAEFMDQDAEVVVDGVGTLRLRDIMPLPFILDAGQEPGF